MIPLSLITGFLGSGKTSLLSHIVRGNRDRRVVYVVNECGEVDVDGRILQIEQGRLVCIPGGSIFCRCLAGEFIDWLTKIPSHWGDAANPIEGVIVEASGIADPGVVGQMLRDTGLDRLYDLRMIVAVVDPGSFLKLIHTLSSIVGQIVASRLVIVNKIDLHDEDTLRRTEDEIRAINADVDIIRTQYGRVDFDAFGERPVRPPSGHYALCRDPNFSVTTVLLTEAVDVNRLADALRDLGQALYRAKGFVPSHGGWKYVDLSAGGLAVQPAATSFPGSLVLIASPTAQPHIDRLAAEIRGGVYAPRQS